MPYVDRTYDIGVICTVAYSNENGTRAVLFLVEGPGAKCQSNLGQDLEDEGNLWGIRNPAVTAWLILFDALVAEYLHRRHCSALGPH
jgi:hypothetical protein